MTPIVFELGSLTIRWYGIFVALGFLAGLIYMQVQAGRKGSIPTKRIADIMVFIMIGGIAGARLLYVVTHFDQYENNLFEIIRIDHGGLVFYGGFFGGAIATILFCRHQKWNLWELADLAAPALAIGQMFGRIGCFMNGCCFGRVTDHPWFRVLYPAPPYDGILSRHHIQGLITEFPAQPLPVVPSQVSQSVINLFIFLILLFIIPKLKHHGQGFAIFILMYASGRFFNEFLRGDYKTSDIYGPFTVAQAICLILLPVGITLFIKLRTSSTVKTEAVALSDDK
jgi:phosphatidylglycerol---prolipoprotein diacylglyceryl transferase